MEQEFVIALGLRSLDLIGLHPFKSSFIGNVKIIVFAMVTIICYSLNIAGVIFKYEGIRSLADTIDAVPAGQQSVVKLLSAIFLAKRMKSLYSMVEQKWPDNVYGEKLENSLNTLSRQFKKFLTAYRMTYCITGILYISKPLVLFSKILITEWYIPCDISNDYCYVIFLIAQIGYIGILAFVVFTFDAIFYAFLFHAYFELEKVKYGLKHLRIADTGNDDNSVHGEFVKIVRYHTFLLKFLDRVNSVYYLQLLNHFTTFVATIVFGIFFMNMDGFPPSANKLSRYIPYLFTHHFQLYMYCILGEMVYYQMCSIGDMMYQSKWHVKRQPKLTRDMLMIMIVSRGKNKLSIGNLWRLNLATFMQVIKTSASFHAFMQTIYNAENIQNMAT